MGIKLKGGDVINYLIDGLNETLIENNSKVHLISNITLIDEDILSLLNFQIPSGISIYILSSTIEIHALKNKQIEKLIKKFKFKYCSFYVSKKFKITEKMMNLIGLENKIIYNTVIKEILYRNNNKPYLVLSDIEAKTIYLKDVNLKDIELVISENFFQLIKNKKIENVKLPKIDFRNYNINGVEFKDCKFHEDTIFPKSFFQQIKHKKLVGCSLPKINISKEDIMGCTFMFVRFYKETTFSNEDDLFLGFDLIYGCRFPEKDYSRYNFTGANIRYCVFPDKSRLPYSQNLFDTIIENQYPKSYINLIHMMPLDNINYEELMMKYGKRLTPIQKTIIELKYKNSHTGSQKLW